MPATRAFDTAIWSSMIPLVFPSANRSGESSSAAGRLSPRGSLIALIAIFTIGAAIRLWQYWLNPSLWMDEASLSLNIVTRSLAGLFQPLASNQAAPIGFLLIQRCSVLLFGNNEYALRLFPLLCGLASLPAFGAVARRAMSGPGLFTATLLFALSPRLIFHAVEAKQYECDAFAVVAALWIGVTCWEPSLRPRNVLMFGLVGSALLAISHAAIFAFGGVAMTLLARAFLRRDWFGLRPLATLFGIWLVMVAALYAVSLRGLTRQPFLLAYWRDAFAPFPPVNVKDFHWYLESFGRFLFIPLGIGRNWMNAAVLLLGIAALPRIDRRLFWLQGSCLLLALTSSALRQYPLQGRLLIFLVPCAILCLGAAIELLWNSRRWILRVAAVLMAVVLVEPQVQRVAAHPTRGRAGHELRPVLRQLSLRRQPHDVILLYYHSTPSFTYYAPKFGLQSATVIPLPGTDVNQDALAAALHRLPSQGRVWLVISHINYDHPEDDRHLCLRVLDALGRRVDSIEAHEAFAYLYQL